MIKWPLTYRSVLAPAPRNFHLQTQIWRSKWAILVPKGLKLAKNSIKIVIKQLKYWGEKMTGHLINRTTVAGEEVRNVS